MRKLVLHNVLLSWCVILCGCTKNIKELMETKRETVAPLQCIQCHSETMEGCWNFTSASTYDEKMETGQTCDGNSTMCIVRRFSVTVSGPDGRLVEPMRHFAVKRNCSSTCEPGCVIMGERTRLYVCNSCCSEDLCNVGNGCEDFGFKPSWIYLSLSAVLVCFPRW